MNVDDEFHAVDELAILDLDRTLLNTSTAAQLVLAGLASYGVSDEEIRQVVTYVESQTGNSFALFDFLILEFGEEVTAGIMDDLLKNDVLLDEQRNNLLCEGADKLIDILTARSIPHLILTYGEKRYQEFKIQLFRKFVGRAENELPAIITTTPNKSEWVAKTWFDSKHSGVVPSGIFGEQLRVGQAVIMDDKRQNLISKHSNVRGILIDNITEDTPSAISITEVANALEDGATLVEVERRVKEGAN